MTGDTKPTLWIAAALYLPFVVLGYGTDPDTYAALEAGGRLLEGEGYRPSRNPGFLLHEVTSAALARLGGSVLTNCVTALVALAAIACFLELARRHAVPHRRLLALVLAAHPWFWIAATSTVDHLWAVAGLLAGLLLLERDRPLAAGWALGLAAGFRLAALPIALAILLVASASSRLVRRIVAGIVASAVGALCYVPSFIHAGHTLAFLDAYTGPPELWSLSGHLGRFAFKNVCLFFGLPATLVLLCLMPASLRALRRAWAQHKAILAPSLAAFVVTELLYLQFPLEPSYLLPGLPFLLLVVGIVWAERKRWLIVTGALILSTSLVLVVIARPDVPRRATGARFGLWVERGTLVRDVQARVASVR
jgi:hypothetical protein